MQYHLVDVYAGNSMRHPGLQVLGPEAKVEPGLNGFSANLKGKLSVLHSKGFCQFGSDQFQWGRI